jgi:Zn-dependent peptidase ImmA (M78 family)
MSVSELAEIIGQSAERVQNLEAGLEAPSLPLLRKLADATRRPLAAFYLPDPPSANPVDAVAYRTLGSARPPQSHKAVFGQRRVYSLRETMLELLERMGEGVPSFPTLPADSSPTAWLEFWRQSLEVREHQRTTREPRDFFAALRGKLEGLGVLVVQLAHVSPSVFRGFLLPEKVLPTIGLNWSDAYSAKNFTLAHELAHLVFQHQGRSFANHEAQESACNSWAAELLVPLNDLLQSPVVQQHEGSQWTDSELLTLAKTYKVSREVIALRLGDAGLADSSLFRRVRGLSPYDKASGRIKEDSGTALPRHLVAMSLLGRGFTSLVLSGYAENVLSLKEATTYLGLSPQHLPKLTEQLAKSAV